MKPTVVIVASSNAGREMFLFMTCLLVIGMGGIASKHV